MKKFYTALIFLVFTILVSGVKNKDAPNENLVLSAKQLNANNISTWFRNNGSFNCDPGNLSRPGFEWPKGTEKYARYTSGLWLGAKVGNDTLLAIAEYTFEYLPGYTDNNGNPQGKDDPLYRTYKLIAGINDQDRQLWPNILLGNSNQGAPVYFDNQTGTWKALDFGTQTIYYVYTDSYPESHYNPSAHTAPLKADIKQLNFSIDQAGTLSNVTFTQFIIINRSGQVWNNFYAGIWTDDDLGNASDDKAGCDSALKLAYTYNASNNDAIYGIAPPAVAFLMLKGIDYYTGNNDDTVYVCLNGIKRAKIGYRDRSFAIFNYADNFFAPANYREVYRFLKGLRRDGSPIINPIGGYVTTYFFSGIPENSTGWIDPSPDDKRFLLSTGPVNLNPGDTQTIVIAQLIGRGTNNLNSITVLRQMVSDVKQFYDNCYNIGAIGIEPISNEVPNRFKLYQNYPNPFNAVTIINFQIPISNYVNLKVYDIMGREIVSVVKEHLSAGTYKVKWPASNFASGVYYYKLTTGIYSETKKMVLIK